MKGQSKIIAENRKARYDYDILDTVEAGLVLTGTEIKSIRLGRANIREAYARPEDGELWLHGMHIAEYPGGNRYNHQPRRPRKLLLHKEQMAQLVAQVQQRGLTLVPLRLYIKNRVAKVELALAKGKKLYDKREAMARREVEREIQRGLRRPL